MERLRNDDYPLRHKLIFVLAGALGLGAACLALILVMGSCSARLDGSLRQDGSARVDFKAEIPSPVAAKLRRLASAGGDAVDPALPLFDLKSIRASIAKRQDFGLIELSQPSPDSIKGALYVKSLERLAASPDFAGSGALAYQAGPGWAELRLRLERGKASALVALMPGLDPYLLEALSPPALGEDGDEGLTAAEYRTMLKSVFGDKAMPALEATAIDLGLSAPGAVLASEGGSLEGATLKLRIPIVEALVLEKPIELRLRWKQ